MKKVGLIFLIVLTVTLSLAGCASNTSSTTSSTLASSSALTTSNPVATNTSTSTATQPATSAKPVTVKVGIIGGETGPAAASVVQMINEVQDNMKYINDVEGGIDGIKLDWKVIDDKGTPEGAIAAYKELHDNYNPQIYFAVEDYYLLAIKNQIVNDHSVIFTSAANDPRCYQPPGPFFSIAIAPADGLAGLAKWANQNWKGPGPLKLGVLTWDLGTADLWKEAQPWITSQGIQITPVQYSVSSLDLKPQLLQFKNAGVNYIWMICLTTSAPIAIRDMNALGLTGKIQMVFNEYVEPAVVLQQVGSAAKGFDIIRSESPYSDGSQAAKMYTDIWATETGQQNKWSDNRLVINLDAAITAAVKQAAADVGPNNITSTAIYNALNKLPSINTWGNTQGFGYGPDRRIGVQEIKIAQFTDTGTKSISNWITLPRTFEGIDK